MKHRNMLLKALVQGSGALLLATLLGCGAVDSATSSDEAAAPQAEELGSAEQAITEAACGTDAVTGAGNTLDMRGAGDDEVANGTGNYGSATCTQAKLVGINIRSGSSALVQVSFFASLPKTAATCTAATVTALYFRRQGAAPITKTAAGTFSSGTCKRPVVTFSTSEVGKPLFGEKARFAIQAKQGAALANVQLAAIGMP